MFDNNTEIKTLFKSTNPTGCTIKCYYWECKGTYYLIADGTKTITVLNDNPTDSNKRIKTFENYEMPTNIYSPQNIFEHEEYNDIQQVKPVVSRTLGRFLKYITEQPQRECDKFTDTKIWLCKYSNDYITHLPKDKENYKTIIFRLSPVATSLIELTIEQYQKQKAQQQTLNQLTV